MPDLNKINNGKVLECFLNLQALKQAYKENEDIADNIQTIIDLLCHLSSENEELKKQVHDFKQRLKSANWIFGGVH